MKAKSILTLIGLAVIVLISVAWLKQAQTGDVTETFLPDHITDIKSTTLPRAIQEGRQRGKASIKITDGQGNTIQADISQPTHTVITVSEAETGDPLTILEEAGLDLASVFDRQEQEDGSTVFSTSEVEHGALAGLMYEVSVRVFNISSTTEWVIDIE